MTRRTLALLVLLSAGCKEAEKPPLRTEPWPAPAAVPVPSDQFDTRVVRYTLEHGSALVELRGKRSRAQAKLAEIEGELELDVIQMGKTRAELRADLLALHFEDPALDASAFRALELGADVPSEDRERERWAKLRILGFKSQEPSDGTRRAKQATHVSAFGELTLHRFRVPIELELDVELSPDRAASLRVRTRRPLVVDLKAHDLAPLELAGTARAPAVGTSGSFSEARVSAELSFRPHDFTGITPKKP